MATLTLRIPDDLDQALEQQSLVSRLSKSDLAREALQRYLRVAQFQALRSTLIQHAEERNVHTDDDVFRVLDTP